MATRFVNKLHESCNKALAFPDSYPERRMLGTGLRVIFHGAYGIYYLHNAAHVTIVRVLHSARDLGAIADEGGFIV